MQAQDQIARWDRAYRNARELWGGLADPAVIGLLGPPPARVLDLGCGNGKTTGALIDCGHDVVGLDFSLQAIERAARTGASLLCADCAALPVRSSTFDLVVAVHVLDHLDDDACRSTCREASRALRTGGSFVAKVFSLNDMRCGKTSDACGSVVRSAKRSDGIYRRFFDADELASLLSVVGEARTTTQRTRHAYGTRETIVGIAVRE